MNIEKIIEQYSAMVLRLARGVLHNIEDARDVSQDVFMVLLRTPNIDNYEGWLYRTTIRRAINFYKQNQSRKAREKNQKTKLEQSACDKLEQQEQLEILQKKIIALPEGQRAVFLLRHQVNLPIKKIAEMLHVTEGTVKKQLSRALVNLGKESHGRL
ncbi:RNA polymerase sigma factor [Candidatus Uabimicrobium sp. HlEnr_7]|uniref:RNA polymerase sigma factor n=1 Tax=Candidatus Uabimicrobium helgolandensis TaxID=3095367 RepID=UPI003558FB98